MKSLLSKFFSKEITFEIEFCQNNLDRFLDEDAIHEFQKLLNQPKIKYKEFECLSSCKLCEKKPYAKLNGELIKADSIGNLISKIKTIINN